VLRKFSYAFLTTAIIKSAAWRSLIPSVAQSVNRGFALEAGKARVQHESHGRDELGSVWAQSEESAEAELLEEGVALRVAPAHQDDHFVIQLE
jgi:hypothetical protein